MSLLTIVRLAVALSLPAATAAADPAPAAATAPSTSDDFNDYGQLDLGAMLNAEVDTGTGFRQKLSELPAVVTVFTRDEILAFGVRTLGELILRLPGVYTQPANMESMLNHAYQLGGGGVSDKILLVIDEHPANDELRETYAPYAIPIDAVERVEFLRGPAAVLYGSSAMAGVIRVKTRRGEALGGGGTVAGTSKKTYDVSAFGTYAAAGGPAVRLDVQALETPLEKIDFARDAAGESGVYPRQVTSLASLATLRWGEWYARVQNHRLATRVFGFQPQLSFGTGTSTLQLHGLEVGYAGAGARVSRSLRAAVDYRKRELDFGMFPPFAFGGRRGEALRTVLTFDGLVSELAGSLSYRGDAWNVVTGLQYRNLRSVAFGFHLPDGTSNPLFPSDDITAQIHDANVFVQGAYDPVEAVEVLAGFRGNYYERRTDNFIELPAAQRNPAPIVSPMGRAGVVWKPAAEISAKLLYGRSFRLPSIFDSYAMIRGVVDPAPGLAPEIEDTVEFAADAQPAAALFVRVNAYENRISKAIEFATAGGGVRRYANQTQRYYVRGVDGSVKWIAAPWASLFASLTTTHAWWDDGHAMPVPSAVAKGGATLSALDGAATLTPFGTHVRKFYGVSYTTWSAALRWAFLGRFAVLASGDNLLNAKVYQPSYLGLDQEPTRSYAVDTRTFKVGVSAEF